MGDSEAVLDEIRGFLTGVRAAPILDRWAAAVRAHGPCDQHRLSYAAKCYGPRADAGTATELEQAVA